MQTTTELGHRAIGGGVVGLLGWLVSHLAQINLWLQFFVLVSSAVAIVLGAAPRVRAWWRMWRS